ncbi:MAG: cupin domain-containing protein [Nitrospiraceae bacterium]
MTTPRQDDHHADSRLDPAILHALGALTGVEAEQYRRLLEDEGAEAQAARAEVAGFQRTAAHLGAAVRPVAPPAHLKATLLTRIQSEPQQSGQADGPVRTATAGVTGGPSSSGNPTGFTFIRGNEGSWIEPRPGMRMKILHVDAATQRTTAVVKFAPGYRHAPHRHAQTEELFVLEGGCVCEGQALFPGDYHRSDALSIHGETTTQDGCTLLIMFSPRNEALGSLSARISSLTVSCLFRLSEFFARLAGTLTQRR